jgi:hypothetical protein
MSTKDKPILVKAKPKGKQRAEGNKTITSDEGANCS